MSPEQRQFIKAVAMDMWDPFIKAVKKTPAGQDRF
jgi:transposase